MKVIDTLPTDFVVTGSNEVIEEDLMSYRNDNSLDMETFVPETNELGDIAFNFYKNEVLAVKEFIKTEEYNGFKVFVTTCQFYCTCGNIGKIITRKERRMI